MFTFKCVNNFNQSEDILSNLLSQYNDSISRSEQLNKDLENEILNQRIYTTVN